MRLSLQLALILFICFAGEFLHRICGIPLPSNIIAMILLFLLLCTKVVKPEQLSNITRFFLNYLPFFFVPASVGLLTAQNVLQGQWLLLLALCIVTTVVTMIATGRTTQFFEFHPLRKKKK